MRNLIFMNKNNKIVRRLVILLLMKFRYREYSIEYYITVSELSIIEPTLHEKRITTRARSHIDGEYDAVLEQDKDIEWHRSVKRSSRR